MSEAASPEEEVTFGDKIKAAKEGDKDTQGLLYKNMDFRNAQTGRICDKTEDVDPIICTGATKPRYRLVVCRWLLYTLLDRRLRFYPRYRIC